MSNRIIQFRTRIARPAADVYAWHGRPGAFARLQPPWEQVTLPHGHPGVTEGSRVTVQARLGPLTSTWVVEHRDVVPGRQFCDVQLSGPFAHWVHTHRFEPVDATSCELVDEIAYRLPLDAAGRIVAGGWTVRKLERLFAYRHAVTKADLEMPPVKPMCVLLAGASGLLGTALEPLLRTQGHEVRRLVRRPPRSAAEILWDPERGQLDPRALAGVDAVVNLAGANIAGGRWTAARRELLRSSRLAATRTLLQAVAAREERPGVFINASASGWYGDGGDELLDETSPSRGGFLADLCEAWEREAAAANDLGLRTVILRLGVVLSPAGGALAKMLPAFRAGVAGRLGSGRQWFSWIALDDALAIIAAALQEEAWQGVYNAVSPAPVRNAEFTATLARVLRRPAVLPVPAAVLRLLFGAMADETLLTGGRLQPQALLAAGHRFRLPELEAALRHTLGKTADK